MKNKFDPIARVIDREATRMARRVWWVDPDDLKQEAWLEMLALPRLDWKKPERAEAYVRRVARARMGRFCWRESAPVTVSKQHGSEKRTAEGLTRTQIHENHKGQVKGYIVQTQLRNDRTPELEVIENEARTAEKTIRAELRKRIGAIAQGAVSIDAVLFVLLDGVEPQEAAKRARVPVKFVYRDTTRAKREALADQVIRELLQELVERRSDLTC